MIGDPPAIVYFFAAILVLVFPALLPAKLIDVPYDAFKAWRSGRWKPSMVAQVLMVIGILAFLAGGAMALMQHLAIEKSNPKIAGAPQDMGQIQALGTNENDREKEQDSEIPSSIHIGTSKFGSLNGNVFEIEGNAVRLDKIDGQLYVSTSIYDDKGRLVAELVKNEWKTAAEPVRFDRNYTIDALEVRGDSGRVVLQVRLLSDHVRMQGEWRSPSTGHGAVLAETSEGALFIQQLRPGQVPSFEIKRLFKYPSDTHFGEYADNE